MKRIFKYILPFILSIFPFVTAAKVYINEIAWMGTDEKFSDEWIELVNGGDTSVDISGWTIQWGADIKDKVVFGKIIKEIGCGNTIIEPGKFLLVGGSGGFSLPNIFADCIYPSISLLDSGTIITLGDPLGGNDTVNGMLSPNVPWDLNGDGKTTGDKEKPKKTAQRTDSGTWITATATPKALNASVSNSNNSSNSGDNDSSSQDSTSTEENPGSSGSNETVQVDMITYDSSAYSSPFSVSSVKEKRKIGMDVGRNRIVLSDSPVSFVGRLLDDSGKVVGGASFDWSFGDGNTASGQNVSHIYRSPTEYVVIEKANLEGEEFVGKSLIKVISPAFTVSGAGKDGGDSYIEIENSLPFEANLRGWKIRSYFNTYTFPSDTIILSGKKVRFYSSTTKINSENKGQIELVSSLGRSFSSFSNKESGKPVDNTVDKSKDGPSLENTGDNSVDNVGKSVGYLEQLSKMAVMLGDMRNSFVAQMPIDEEKISVKKVKSIILSEELNKFEPNLDKEGLFSTSEDFLTATSAENRKIVTLDAPENKKGFWNYVVSLFWQ